jgi:hypothetical protein
VCLAERIAASRFADWGSDDRVVVLSQDCDVVHGSYDAEPTAELIRAKPSSQADGLIRHGRNPRRLQLAVGALFLNFSVHDRWNIQRSELESTGPDPEIAVDGDARHVLTEWVAKRYTRPAFPDAFNVRREAANKKIERELKKHGELITGIFLAIKPHDECGDGTNYIVALRVTAGKATLTNKSVESQLVTTTKQVADALDACAGIEVVDYGLVSEAEFTLEDLQYFQRWDWDYRSHSGEPGGEIAPSR